MKPEATNQGKPVLNYAAPTREPSGAPGVSSKVFQVVVYAATSLTGIILCVEELARPLDVAGVVLGAAITSVFAVLSILAIKPDDAKKVLASKPGTGKKK